MFAHRNRNAKIILLDILSLNLNVDRKLCNSGSGSINGMHMRCSAASSTEVAHFRAKRAAAAAAAARLTETDLRDTLQRAAVSQISTPPPCGHELYQ